MSGINLSITSLDFYGFLAATLLVLLLVPSAGRKSVLLVASALFYFRSGIASTAFTAALIGVNFLFLRLILTANDERSKERLYLWSIAFNVVAFCSMKLVFEPAPNVAPTSWQMLGIQVGYPLGLSFVILMLHSSLTDAYSKKFERKASLSTYFLFGTFFPYITAGPVERLERMEAYLDQPRRPTADDLLAGAALIALGLSKKLISANRMQPYVDSVFQGALPHSSITVLGAIALNAAYIYCDFSGYTDIARGAARCLGMDIQINFNRPFSSWSVTEFWRRWHISFSNWLRDYIYMPIAFTFARRGAKTSTMAILTTFVLCGFWHRAAVTFLVFGLLHGTAMAIEAPFQKRARKIPWLRGPTSSAAARVYVLMFLATTIVLFSAKNLEDAGSILKRAISGPFIPSPTEFFAYQGPIMFLLMICGIIIWQLLEWWHKRLSSRTVPAFLVVAAWLILFGGQPDGQGFIYAQF